MAEWCVDNNLVLNTTKTNEILMDFRRSKRTTQTPITINGWREWTLFNSWGHTKPRT